MPDSIEQYVQQLHQMIAETPIIAGSNVVLDKRTTRTGLIRGDLALRDGSRLYFRELVNTGDFIERKMYSFHYQTNTGVLIFPYDDTAHHRHINSFPHHKHEGSKKNIIAATAPDLRQVLSEIERTVDFGPRS